MTTPTKSQLEFLQSIDTPTVCNLVEIVAPERRGHGYTVTHLHCPFPDLPPIVGFAKTVTFKAKDRVPLGWKSYRDQARAAQAAGAASPAGVAPPTAPTPTLTANLSEAAPDDRPERLH